MNVLAHDKKELRKKFVDSLLITNRDFNFYVNWDNIESYKEYSIELSALDVLIHNKKFDSTFKELLEKLPSVIATFPLLFALSKNERKKIWNGKENLLIIDSTSENKEILEFDFSTNTSKKQLTDEQINYYLFFFENIGLKHLFLNLTQKSIMDYVIGVLVGLDSNGRKNRGGLYFELTCTPIIEKLCRKYDINLITQKKFKSLKKHGLTVSSDIANRKADFILFKDNRYLNIEVNYYNGSGSKPEEIIDSYTNRAYELKKNNIHFALITDGKKCWGNADKPQLLKAFKNLSYFMNFNLAKEGMLEETIKEVFLID